MFLFPMIAGVLLFAVFYAHEKDLIRTLAHTWLVYTAVAWASIEILGWFYLWNYITVSLVWVLVCIVCVVILWNKRTLLREKCDRDLQDVVRCMKQHKGITAATILFCGIIFISAILRSTNNVDSMYYHLSRIMHWIQNHSARYYGGTEAQIKYPSLSEYLVGQIMILGCHDRLANIFQTTAYFCSGCMIYGIGRKLKLSGKTAFASTWIYWLMPMALAQAYNTQTDDIAGMFLLVYIYFLLDFIQAERLQADRSGIVSGIRLAACVGFGYLCKPTICFAILVFFVWMGIVRIIRKDSPVVLIKYVGVGLLTVVIMGIPLMLKNYDLYTVQKQARAAVSSETNVQISTDAIVSKTVAPDSYNATTALKNPKIFIMTCIQNIGRNSTSAYFTKWNEVLTGGINKLGRMLDYDTGIWAVQIENRFWGMDTASNPALMFITLVMIICLILRLSRPNYEQTVFIACAVLSFLMQCGLMGFTHFRTRYLVGVMALLAISAGIALERMRISDTSKNNMITAALTICMFGAINTSYLQIETMVDSFTGEGNVHKYFLDNTLPEQVNEDLVNVITANNFTHIGINHEFAYEYVLWAKVSGLQRLERVNMQNTPYGVYEDMSYLPECIAVESSEAQFIGQEIECHGVLYECVWTEKPSDWKCLAMYKPVEE